MKITQYQTLKIMSLIFFFSLCLCLCFSFSSGCGKSDRLALLDLKSGLQDPAQSLSFWAGPDCCSWAGVTCDNITARVTRLDLRFMGTDVSMRLTGGLNPSLTGLTHLNYLDLSLNDFSPSPFPDFLGSFRELQYLNLSSVMFSGPVPSLSNSLRVLDLSWNYISDDTNVFNKLSALTSLQTLNLAGNQLTYIPLTLPKGSFNALTYVDLSSNQLNSTIPDWIFRIPKLEHLNLAVNSFRGAVPAAFAELTSLNFLSISSNAEMTGPVPKQLKNLCELESLDLSYLNMSGQDVAVFDEVFSGCIKNSLRSLDLSSLGLTGNIQDSFGEIKNLEILHLFGNEISGSLPDSMGKLTKLQTLDITDNKLNGTVATSIGQLSSLVTFGLGRNSMSGVISEAHFANMTNLKSLDFTGNRFVFDIDTSWSPLFQLEFLSLSSCRLGDKFPRWIHNQVNLTSLNLADSGISDVMPEWFWSLTSNLGFLDISNNQISGKLPKVLKFGNDGFLKISLNSNRFQGEIPEFPSNSGELDLSNNSFSGEIPGNIINAKNKSLVSLSISMNNLTGKIPLSVCELTMLRDLDVSYNFLSGEVPDCWNTSSLMQGINVANNHLTGNIPSSLCLLRSLQTVHFSRNKFSGKIPDSVMNCTNLVTLDLSYNAFAGEIPKWIANMLPGLKILSLRANSFTGEMPQELSSLQFLQILDLSSNELSGKIPRSFSNFSAMKVTESSLAPLISSYIKFDDYMELFVKGREMEYTGLLSMLKILDLSDNKLSGNNMLSTISDLIGLQSLNLSNNELTGWIDKSVGKMGQLESLDLSVNKLTGKIPTSLTKLTSLSHLNLSHNGLTGRIPSENQLGTFTDTSIYEGNVGLCGYPLPKCGGSGGGGDSSGDHKEGGVGGPHNDEEEEVMKWALAGAVPGMVVGFSLVLWTMLWRRDCAAKLLGFVDSVYDSGSKYFVSDSSIFSNKSL